VRKIPGIQTKQYKVNTIWGFGDSFTFGHGCRPDGPLSEYYNEYRIEGDKVWLEWLGEWKNMNTINLGVCGASNEYIFDSVLDNHKNIKSGDVVIIGSTLWGRRDIPIDGRWLPLLSILEADGEVVGVDTMSLEDRNLLIDYQLKFGENPMWKVRMSKRYEFLKETLSDRGVEVLLWNIKDEIIKRMEKIGNVSPYMDYHFSFTGHKKFAEYLLEKLSNKRI
jgi:hypothetical protein